MKSLFLYVCFEDDLHYLPEDIEYLFINTLVIDTCATSSKDVFIKPNINPSFKFMYVHRVRVKTSFYKAKVNMILPFGAKYFYNRYSYNLYNFEIEKSLLIKYIEDAENVICKDIVYQFNIRDESDTRNLKYKSQIFADTVCIHPTNTI